jgi:hypothetical protein
MTSEPESSNSCHLAPVNLLLLLLLLLGTCSLLHRRCRDSKSVCSRPLRASLVSGLPIKPGQLPLLDFAMGLECRAAVGGKSDAAAALPLLPFGCIPPPLLLLLLLPTPVT